MNYIQSITDKIPAVNRLPLPLRAPIHLSKIAVKSLFHVQNRLPDENKVVHCVRETFAVLGKLTLIGSYVFTLKTLTFAAPIPFALILLGLGTLIVSNVVEEILPERIQTVASYALVLTGAAIAGIGMNFLSTRLTISVLKTVGLGLTSMVAGSIIFRLARNNDPASVSIGNGQESLSVETLDQKLEEILQTRRKIKRLEIHHAGANLTLRACRQLR